MAGNPEPDTWEPLTLTSSCPETLKVPRANWYEQVLAPTRNEQYRYIELALTAVRPDAHGRVGKRRDAARSCGGRLRDQRPSSVFPLARRARRSAWCQEARPLDGVSDTNKRSRLDTLLKDAGEFLHTGRHVAKLGKQAGSFPVTHVDAAFALDLLRVLLSHMSLLLVADSP